MTNGDMRHAESRVTLRFERFASFVEEYSSNISLGGVFIKTHKARPVGTEIHFEFKLVDGFRLLHGQGQVVWVRLKDRGDAAPAGMGVRFTAIDDSGRQLVLKLLEEQVKSGGAPFEVETVPPDADATPVAPADTSGLPDLSEEPTLIGHVPAVALPEEAASEPQAGGEGFDAPWGENLPSIPNDLLDEENDPEVEEAVRSIRPDPSLAVKPAEESPEEPASDDASGKAPEAPAGPPESPPSLIPAVEAEDAVHIPSVRAESSFPEVAAAPSSDIPPAAPASPPEMEPDIASVAPYEALAESQDMSPAETAQPRATTADFVTFAEPAGVEPPAAESAPPAEEPLQPIFELETAPPAQQLDLLGEDPTVVSAPEPAESGQEELVFEPPPEDELPFDPEMPAAPPAPVAPAEEPAFELEGGGDPSLDATDFTFVSTEDEAAAPATDVRGISQSTDSWITAAAPLPPQEEQNFGEAAADSPGAGEPGAAENSFSFADPGVGPPAADLPPFEAPAAEAPTFDAAAFEPSGEAALPSFEAPPMESFEAPSFDAGAFEPPPAQPAEESFGELDFESSPSVAPLPPAEDSVPEISDDPALMAQPLPHGESSFEAPSFESPAFEAPAMPMAGGVDDLAPPAVAPVSSEAAAFASAPESFADEIPAPAPPMADLAADGPAMDFPASAPEAAPAFGGGGDGTPHTGLFANAEGEPNEQLEATEEWPTSDEPVEEEWMKPEKSSRRWLPLAAASVLILLLAASFFFRQELAGLVGLSSNDTSQVAQGPPPGGDQAPTGQGAADRNPGPPGEATGAGSSPVEQAREATDSAEPAADSESASPAGGLADAGSSSSSGQADAAATSAATDLGADSPADTPAPSARREAPPPPAPARESGSDRSGSANSRVGARARQVVDVSWQRQSTGTRISIQFDGAIDSGRFRHDELAWAGDRERIVMNGLDNFRLATVDVGTPELRRIRIGHHPGQELHFVFDLADTEASLSEISANGQRLEILVQSTR